jgi:hypothetical protein
MGHSTRNLTYVQGTNTLSGVATQDQEVWAHVDGAITPIAKVKSHPVTGAFSMVLTGLSNGAHTVRCSLNGTSLGPMLAITKI